MVNYKTIMTFGKHKGKTVREVMETDASYLLWADKNVQGFELSDYLRDKAEEYSYEDNINDLVSEYMAEDWGDKD